MRLLVTGANGFVGRSVCELAGLREMSVRRAVRHAVDEREGYAVGDIHANTDWRAALAGIDCVIHLVGRAHVMRDAAIDPLAAYREVNVAGSVALAGQAAAYGVRRLVYVSSIKACCEQTFGEACREDSPARQEDAYGQSKFEAEQALWAVARETGMELVVVRPVMVIGPGVKGNLALLAGALRRGLPLPLAGLKNRRSLVEVNSLADLLLLCAEHPAAAGQTFLAAADECVSTTAMVRSLAEGLGCSARLWPMPLSMLRLAGALTGKREVIRRLTNDLEVDASRATALLGWRHGGGLKDALRAVGQSFRREF